MELDFAIGHFTKIVILKIESVFLNCGCIISHLDFKATSLNSGLQFSVFRVSVFVIKLIATYLIFLYSYAQLPVGILSIANKEKIQLIFIFTITP